MPTQTFTDDVIIDGSQDEVQLIVQGHSVQNEPLQTWEDSGATKVAQITADGRFQNGDMSLSTADALIEAHRDSGSSLPKRGFHTLGKISDVLGTAVAWSVHELQLLGSSALSTLQSALRVRLRNENTGSMSAVQLLGADIEVQNAGGAALDKVPDATALRVAVDNELAGYLATAYGLKIEMLNAGVRDQAYAIHTDEGLVHVGDALELAKLLAAPAAEADHIRVYGRDEAGALKLFAKTPDDVEHDLLAGGSGEANTASTVGSAGIGVFKQKTGVDFEFKTLNAASNKLSITDDLANSEVDLDVNEANLSLANLGGTLPVLKGGTGAIDAPTALSNLGAQVQDVVLDDIAGMTLIKGDLLIFNGTNLSKIGVGSDGQHLEADSVQSAGVKWATPSGGGSSEESLLHAYDALGGLALATTPTVVTLDSIGKLGADYLFTAGGSEITFQRAGWYELTYYIGTDCIAGSARTESMAQLEENTGAGFVVVPGTQGGMYNRIVNRGLANASVTTLRQFQIGDKIRITAYKTGTDTIQTVPNGVGITIREATRIGPKGDIGPVGPGGGGTAGYFAGDLKMVAYATPPVGWLLCDGAAVSRSSYADLFSAIGTSYGVGDGSTTFNLPDIRGRVPIGAGTGSGLTTRTLADSFGEEGHQLIETELPAHTHRYFATKPAQFMEMTGTGSLYAGSYGGAGQGHRRNSAATQLAGSDIAHNNMQPSLAINYIIKT